jgi:crossover junction endodeoxyribonuclease RuvC
MKMVIGVDIGLAGAVALLLENGELVEVHDMPVLADGTAKRRTINAVLLGALVRAMAPDRAFVEHVAARPGEGAVGGFAFGRAGSILPVSATSRAEAE